ncbi:MAG: hypothetical protein J2P57_11465 [Acidimicrobiaceae bacterium]|nr:hypothetical protein [Acidimicrobiaceae bacterium]
MKAATDLHTASDQARLAYSETDAAAYREAVAAAGAVYDDVYCASTLAVSQLDADPAARGMWRGAP